MLVPVINVEIPIIYSMPVIENIKDAVTVIDGFTRTESLGVNSYLLFSWVIFLVGLIIYTAKCNLKYNRIIKNSAKLVDFKTDKSARNISYFKSNTIQSPFYTGFFNFKIVLPRNWDSFPPKIKSAIISHELEHINNRDHFLNLFLIISCILNFFNPIIWVFAAKVKKIREISCDVKAVSSAGLGEKRYSNFLLNFASGLSIQKNHLELVNTFSISYKNIKSRINYLLDKKGESLSDNLLKRHYFILSFLFLSMVSISINCTEVPTILEEEPEAKIFESNEIQSLIEIPDFIPFEDQPQIIGGLAKLQSMVKYPKIALRAEIEGRVTIKVLITENGQITNIRVLESLGKACDNANASSSIVLVTPRMVRSPINLYKLSPAFFMDLLLKVISGYSSTRKKSPVLRWLSLLVLPEFTDFVLIFISISAFSKSSPY